MKDFKQYTTIDSVKNKLKSIEKNVVLIFELNQWPVKLDDQIDDDDRSSRTYAESIGKEDTLAEFIELKDQMESIFAILDDKEKLILGHSFGIHIGDLQYEKLRSEDIIKLLGEDIKYTAIMDRRRKIIRKIRNTPSLWTEVQQDKLGRIKPMVKRVPEGGWKGGGPKHIAMAKCRADQPRLCQW